ncbi:MAG: CHASE domain-containing protein [Magnetospirillum gryphiswaldense]|nr:CHASE domain-containing protein [Magnetospirillum gryphiswaldense]
MLAVLLAVSLALSVFIWHSEVRREESTARADFERSVDQIYHALSARLDLLQSVLRAGAGVWAEHPDLSANQWDTFVRRALLDQDVPGIDGIAFAQSVAAEDKDTFVADIRQRLWRHFAIHPTDSTPSSIPSLGVVTHFAPLSRSAKALGYNIASHPGRWRAAEMARDTGKSVLSEPLQLMIQDSDERAFLMVYPVYGADYPTANVDQRRKALRGWLLLGMHSMGLIDGVVRPVKDPTLHVRVYSGAVTADGVIYGSDDDAPPSEMLFETLRSVDVAGVRWTIQASRHLPALSLWLGPSPLILLVSCVAFSLVLTMAAALMLVSRQQSRQLAAQAMGQLDRAERTLAGITASVPGTVFQWLQSPDGNGRFSVVSSQAQAMFGVPAQVLIDDWRNLPFTPEELAEWPLTMAEAAAVDGEWQMEGRYLAPGGEKRWWKGTASPNTGADGVISVNGVFVDITDQKDVQRQLAEREQTYREMFERTSAVKVLIDPESGRIIDANAAALSYYGYESNQTDATSIHQVSLLNEADLKALMQRSAQGEQQFFRSRHRLASGEIREVEVHLGPVSMHGRRFVHAIVHDVTDRERFQAELLEKSAKLEESNAELQQFSYVVSHDLQEPLRTIASFLQLLERRYEDKLDEDGRQFIDFAVDAARRQQAMIQSLLEYSRVGTRGRPFARTEMTKVAALAKENLAMAIAESAAQVEIGDLPVVMADETQMVSLLQNLMGNALKYRRDDVAPVIRLLAQDDGERWIFTVADNGIGIDPQYFDRIFQVFQRLHTREKYGGTGIGLALCRKIVQRHGGEIWVQSQPGQGSSFHFSLPKAVKSGSA